MCFWCFKVLLLLWYFFSREFCPKTAKNWNVLNFVQKQPKTKTFCNCVDNYQFGFLIKRVLTSPLHLHSGLKANTFFFQDWKRIVLEFSDKCWKWFSLCLHLSARYWGLARNLLTLDNVEDIVLYCVVVTMSDQFQN